MEEGQGELTTLTFAQLFQALESDLKFIRRCKGCGIVQNLDSKQGDDRHDCEIWRKWWVEVCIVLSTGTLLVEGTLGLLA